MENIEAFLHKSYPFSAVIEHNDDVSLDLNTAPYEEIFGMLLTGGCLGLDEYFKWNTRWTFLYKHDCIIFFFVNEADALFCKMNFG